MGFGHARGRRKEEGKRRNVRSSRFPRSRGSRRSLHETSCPNHRLLSATPKTDDADADRYCFPPCELGASSRGRTDRRTDGRTQRRRVIPIECRAFFCPILRSAPPPSPPPPQLSHSLCTLSLSLFSDLRRIFPFPPSPPSLRCMGFFRSLSSVVLLTHLSKQASQDSEFQAKVRSDTQQMSRSERESPSSSSSPIAEDTVPPRRTCLPTLLRT